MHGYSDSDAFSISSPPQGGTYHINIIKVSQISLTSFLFFTSPSDLSDVESTIHIEFDSFVRPSGYESMSQHDIDQFRVPTPPGNRIGQLDTRLAILRPHFAEMHSVDMLIKNVSKYNQKQIQRNIINNAKREDILNSMSTRLNKTTTNAHTTFARQHGLIALLTQVINERKKAMVQPINILTMVPLPTVRTLMSQPPPPTTAALAVMGNIHHGIKLHIDPTALIAVQHQSRELGINLAIERSVRKQVDKGHAVALPLSTFDDQCAKEHLHSHISSSFFVAKDRTDPNDAGRHIIDLTASGINSLESKQLLADRDGPYRDATAVYICNLALEARARNPDSTLVLCKCDVESCFKRIPMDPQDIPMTATVFYSTDGTPMVSLSTGANFGLNASNSTQKSLTEAMHAGLLKIDYEDFGHDTGSVYLDDFFAIRTLGDQVVQFFRTRNEQSDRFMGINSISKPKSEWGEVLQLLGYLFNMVDMSISVSDTLLEKYIWVLFHILPMEIRRGSSISLEDAQRATSYLHIVSIIVPCLHAYSNGLARATRGVIQQSKSRVYISTDALIDIIQHREFVHRLFYDARCLALPMRLLSLRTIKLNETEAQLQQRQMESADFILFSDARGISNGHWGNCWMVAPRGTTIETQDHNIVDYDYGEWDALFEPHAIIGVKDLNIALLEMITTLCGAFAFLCGGKAPIRRQLNQLLHIHTLTDSHVSYYRLLKNKGTHPIVPFLLRIQSCLQQEKNVIFTYGTIKSADNRFTDAGSRNFDTEYGPQALVRCQHVVRNRLLPHWWNNLQATLLSLTDTPSHRKHERSTNQN